MQTKRVFLQTKDIQDYKFTISERKRIHHLRNVLRTKQKDYIQLLDNKGNQYIGEVEEISKDFIKGKIIKKEPKPISSCTITLIQSIIKKPKKMEFIIKKATELGVSQIIPLLTQHCVVNIKDPKQRLHRWQRIAKESALQNSLIIPKIENIIRFNQLFPLIKDFQAVFLFTPKGEYKIKDILRQGLSSLAILIGPEGDFSEKELFEAKKYNIPTVRLSDKVFQSDTASIIAITIILYELNIL